LALHFLEETNLRFARNVLGFDMAVIHVFEQYQWPGNVRQLLREIERLVALTKDDELIRLSQCSQGLRDFYEANDLLQASENSSLSIPTNVALLEKKLIRKALRLCNGNKSKAAKQLGLTRQGLSQKLKRYKLADTHQ
jgi:transcriptional regulator with PAS, ATPase and Fis domain